MDTEDLDIARIEGLTLWARGKRLKREGKLRGRTYYPPIMAFDDEGKPYRFIPKHEPEVREKIVNRSNKNGDTNA